MFSRILATAALAAPLVSGAIIDVFVGGEGKLLFTPESVTANVGDSIRFTFGRKNHTVTQSTFESPCTSSGGFFSGYMPVAEGQINDLPQFWIPVKDTKPIWAFCGQGNHCQQGMVFAVNAAADPDPKSFVNFKALATGQSTVQPVVTTSVVASPVTTETPVAADDPYGYGGADPAPTTAVPSSSAAPVTTSISANNAAATGVAAGSGKVHQVIVGGTGQLTFQPDHVAAAEGDVVQFVFKAKNHTVTQSSFRTPCQPLAGGFNSGFLPSDDVGPNFPTYSYTVTNASAPVWWYCAQGNHCGAGMVFAINSNETGTNNFAAFQAIAKGGSPPATASGSAASATVTANSASSVLANGKAMVVVLSVVSAAFALVL